VLDVKDIANPKVIGSYDYHPPFPEPTHTVMPFEQPIGGAASRSRSTRNTSTSTASRTGSFGCST
jgi:hypothetical protein